MNINKNYNSFFSLKYKYGFNNNILSSKAKKGLDFSIIEYISVKKTEPILIFLYRLLSYRFWLSMSIPCWAELRYKNFYFKNLHCFAEPKSSVRLNNLNKVDSRILKIYDKLGIPVLEQKILSGVAVDAVFDSVSVTITYKKELKKYGIIFCSISEAVKKYYTLFKLYFGSVISYTDNFFSALNSSAYSDGTFIYIPKNVTCPLELSSYFRINELQVGQFERTLIITDIGSNISYLEGCTAAVRDVHQLHAAVVELIALRDSSIKYSTVQNWYSGNLWGRGGIYNFVTKRGICYGKKSKISWIQLEIGAAITWKYPSCILQGEETIGKFFSVALTNNYQQADTGTKIIHIGENTYSIIIAKGIASGKSSNIYRGLVHILYSALNSRNYTQCDSLIIGKFCSVATLPHIRIQNCSSYLEHEASVSQISDEQLQFCQLRGIDFDDALSLLVSGFCKSVFIQLPLEFFMEAKVLLYTNLEGAVG